MSQKSTKELQKELQLDKLRNSRKYYIIKVRDEKNKAKLMDYIDQLQSINSQIEELLEPELELQNG